jgi:hypothetical protein
MKLKKTKGKKTGNRTKKKERKKREKKKKGSAKKTEKTEKAFLMSSPAVRTLRPLAGNDGREHFNFTF